MNSTAAMLRKIKDICEHSRKCKGCPLWEPFCTTVASYWTDKDIEEIEEAIDNYEEEEE